MVKAVVGEETHLKSVEDRLTQSAVPSEIGLVIGKLSSSLDRGFVFGLIPTPANDAGEPACSLIEGGRDDKKKGSKAKSQPEPSSLVIDKDWVSEHARQVSRMLVGGMKVVGIYIWVNDNSFKYSTITLCQTVMGVSEAAPLTEIDRDERLLIHISYSPRRWTCRNCSLASNITSSSLRPCDFKMGRTITSLQAFRCTYNFELRLPICRGSGSSTKRLADHLRREIIHHAKELEGAKALINGKLVKEDEQCVFDGLQDVEFLLPFMHDSSAEACSQKEVLGVLVFSGCVCSFAFVNSKELISQALDDVKGDIISSLHSRLDIICDEADGEVDSTINDGRETDQEISNGKTITLLDLQELRRRCSLSFPRRVFVPWQAGTYICDYLQSSETTEVIKDHCVELMSMEAPTDLSTILEPETEVLTLTTSDTKSFWDVAVPSSSASISDHSSSEKRGIDTSLESNKNPAKVVSILAAVLIVIVSILVGRLLFVVRAS